MKTANLFAAALFAGWQLLAQSPSPDREKKSYEFDVAGDQRWLDTKVDVQAGDMLRITATGTLQYAAAKASGPEGLARGWRDLIRILPLNEAGRGALLGRVGSDDGAMPFLIGPRRDSRAPYAGRLFLGINQEDRDQADGSLHVKIEVEPQSKASAAATKVTPIEQEVLDKIPVRIADQQGDPGDRVNFLIVGSEGSVRQLFDSGGWSLVDRTKKDAVLHGLLASLSKQAYLEMPMSELYLFGRAQDFGYAHAEPLQVVASRHHLRLWKVPFDARGQTVWAGAATHDIGFERDQRNGSVTHKIDPDVDLEREYLAKTLNDTGLVAKLDYMTPSQPVKEARTATGGSFHSDGRTLLVYLNSDGNDRSAAFADLFCTVLGQENPDTGEWGDCAQYLDAVGKNTIPLRALGTQYRVLIVPGFMSACASSAPAFDEGQKHLRDKHGMTVELMSIPNDSSEKNASQIAQYLKEHMQSDARKYIVLGYSKGAPDLQVALAKESGAASAVAAFISVAGAVGGSPIADALPAQINQWTQRFSFGKCEGDLAAAVHSLRRDTRRAFLASYPEPVVPSYSLVAVSDKTNTSKMLLENWILLSIYGSRQDSQLTAEDAMVPGAKYLGAARADHLAVALPFEKMGMPEIAKFVDHGHYPRAALLEALVRFVVGDLGK